MAPKKQKGEKMSVGAFLQDENLGSWADEMEDMPLPSSGRTGYGGGNRTDYGSSTGGMGSSGGYARTDGYSVREELPLPTQPPYTAHLGNMSFDATQGDVADFFQDCDVSSVRIVEDKMDRKPKGFGYVEFNTVDGLKKALTLNGTNMGGRMIRISVADPPKNDRQDTRDYGDWSRKGPLPDLPGSQRRVSERPAFQGRSFDNPGAPGRSFDNPGAPGRSFDNMSDAGSERGGRRPFEQAQGDGKIRDFSNWERKGPLSPSTTAPPSLRDGGRQNSRGVAGDPALRRNSPAWGEGTGRSQDGSRPPRRDFSERQVVERAPTAAELDNKWRTNMRPDPPAKSPTPETSAPGSPAPSAAATAPTTRPKLNLTKRTVSEADPGSPPPSTDSKASPFGAARPVDTLAREKEIEEKRELAIRQKKDADDKTREEKAEQKRLAKDKADAEKAKAAETEDETEKPISEDPSEAKENGTESSEKSTAAPKFEVLRRATSTDNDMVPAEDEEESEPAAIVADKAVKPKEVIRDARPPKTNGAWRNNNNGNKRDAPAPKAAAPAPESTTTGMEEDGWSTVTSTKRANTKTTNRRGGGGSRGDRGGGDNAPARAIAS